MYRYRRLKILLALFLVLWTATPARAQTDGGDLDATSAVTRGQQISAAVSTVTSVAISPLLGVCLLGAWNYFRTEPAQRSHLPFYNFPVFWIPIGILLILIFIKDTVGGFAPLIKKPLDAIEVLLLNKASLVIIGFPVLFHQIESIVGARSLGGLFSGIVAAWEPVVHAAGPPSGVVDTAGHVALTVLALLAGSAALIVVWLVGHAIDVLLLLSPFPFLDVVLKGFKVVIFAILVGTSLVSRTAGLALSLVVILICALCAGWTIRLSLFGTIFAWDLLRTMLLGLRRKPDAQKGIRCFSVGKRLGIRKRTYGKLVSPDGSKLEFRYRRMGFGPVRRVALTAGDHQYEIGRGLLQPSLIARDDKDSKHRVLFRMLPSYGGSEELLRSQLGIQKVSDIRIPSGLRSFWGWLNDSGEEELKSAV